MDDDDPPGAPARPDPDAALLDRVEAAFLAASDQAGLDAAWRACVAPAWDGLDADMQDEIGRIYARHLSTLSWSR